MKLPDFNRSTALWDRYRRFYNDPRPWFIRFESGEAIITKANFTPFERRMLSDTDLQIVSTRDEDCPRLQVVDEHTLAELASIGHDMRGKTIPKAWLQNCGSQTLLVDKTTKRVVRLGTNQDAMHDAWKHVPTWVRPGNGWASNAVAFLPGNDRDAIACKLSLTVPIKVASAVRRALSELRAGCSAWCSMCSWDYAVYAPKWWVSKGPYHTYIYHRPFERKSADTVPDISELSGEERFQIARFGFDTIYKHMRVDSMQVCQ